ncbi:DNA-binding protein RFX2 isoform X2 [Frankliniella occidentalis]|uniref:DNA-binding protein RFX2 isoform X2 n=1 Tax=Frankliniella occidentalis TaxID=133901 RepID=A0A9C6U232_FRAOC|nr:DNA-binding protein RFX2 isoform X2 [Frankliniella occidentalis]
MVSARTSRRGWADPPSSYFSAVDEDMASTQSFDLTGAGPSGADVVRDGDSPPISLRGTRARVHSMALQALQNGSVDGSSSGESCDGTVTTAVVVGSTDDDETGDAHVMATSALVGSHYIAVTEEDGSRSYAPLTPLSTVVGDGDGVGVGVGSEATQSQGIPQTYVQFVGEAGDQTIYTTTNGQMAYTYVGDYQSTSGQFYTGTTTPVTYSQTSNSIGQTSVGSSHILTQNTPAGTFIIQSPVEPDTSHTILSGNRSSPQTVTADGGGVSYLNNNSPLDEDGPSHLSHATRVSPATVQWLLENYETAEGVSLPRSTLYYHYLRHCNDHKLDPVNAASFGKLIRSVFLGLRTRRLGTRGNSKYHYYGIRVKPGSQLTNVSDDGSPVTPRSQASKRTKALQRSESTANSEHSSPPSVQTHQNNHQQYLGDSTQAIPDFPRIEFPSHSLLPEDCTLEDVDTFRSIYREHCEAFLDAIVNLEFMTVESLWREFWRSQDNNNGDECEEEKYLSKTKLFLLCNCTPIQNFVRAVDFAFYQKLVEVLIPDVLRPIPTALTQAIRNFSKGLESWLTVAMVGCPDEMKNIKLGAAGAFAQTLRRYTSLNHLAQAARAVLQNSSQINQMLTDLNRVDFHNVQEQASWVCQCDSLIVQQLETDFKMTLQQQNSLEQWAEWLQGVVDQILKPYEGKPNFSSAARQFLLKWSFYNSMVIRDLTLRSAASFGSFHLIRLLYDEYMFYLVEHRVAKALGETPIAVIGEKGSETDYLQNGNSNSENSLAMDHNGTPSVVQLNPSKKFKLES